MNGVSANPVGHTQQQQQSQPHPSQTSPGGFVAVNSRPHQHESNGNGTSSTTRHDLMSKFHTVSERRPSTQPVNGTADARRQSMMAHGISQPSTPVTNASRAPSKPVEAPVSSLARPSHMNESELQSMMNSPVPIPNTPSNLLPAASQRNSQPQEREDGGPFKTEMVQRMESLAKGERIQPPCDRCRRLHMDCLKNLTACMGCTKKHAKCSWKEVREGELRVGYAHPVGTNNNAPSETSDPESGDRASTASPPAMLSPPPHRALTPSHLNGSHTPQPVLHHIPLARYGQALTEFRRSLVSNEAHTPQSSQHDVVADAHTLQPQSSTPERRGAREDGGNVEVQLLEAAKSSLAHGPVSAIMGAPEAKSGEFPQTMVA
jgi:hypothetical protein